MQLDPQIEAQIKTLAKMKGSGAFAKYIDYIVFPRYRNIAPDAKIEFSFPLTVLVGQNGSGKSAVLQALSGAPHGVSVGVWWFETAVDPIYEPEVSEPKSSPVRSASLPADRKSAFWYCYKENDLEKYALKTRIKRANDPDYWEPSRPIAGYGMPRMTRDEPIKMESIYINFKLNVSAFDKCFYFHSKSTLVAFAKSKIWQNGPKPSKQPRVQDYLRHKSKRLKVALEKGKILMHFGKNQLNERAKELNIKELSEVNKIIGKNYTAGKVIRHRFFEGWGLTVAFSTKDRAYTDAFAGSGEGAVVRLVTEIEQAKPGSLILLDEPETSLHPGAQERMLAYILEKVKTDKHQVVISTHSPTLVQHLPKEAIKVFSLNPEGNSDVVADCPPEEAFHYIGHRYDANITIIVEDRLAKEVVETAIQSNGEAFAKNFNVIFGPGGISAIKKEMVVYSRQKKGPLVLFDGDQLPTSNPPHIDTNKIARGDMTDQNLKNLVDKQAGKIDFAFDSNMAPEQKIKIYTDYLDYYRDNVHYLPFSTPDEAIWDDDLCILLSTGVDPVNGAKKAADINKLIDPKEKFRRISSLTGNVDSIHQLFIAKFKNTKHSSFVQLVDLVKKLA